ncbi:zinc finger protein 593-like [Oscarella lobularis]|uniref:zinc finger protein 593-like n=1 Tax=Oscarella lobularis TaxID=121494 RepID=UPI0033143DA9
MGRLRRKRVHKNIKDTKKKFRTRRRTKDIDQIHDDLKPENAEQLKRQNDPDLPGFGQHYCLECSRHFIDEKSLSEHVKSKVHKRRLKELSRAPPYTQEEADAAAGLGSYRNILERKKEFEVERKTKMDESK